MTGKYLFGLALVLTLFPTVAAQDLPNRAVARFGSPALRHGERPLALALDAAGKRLVSGGPDGAVKLWDTATGKLLGSHKVKDGFASSVTVAADGSVIAAVFGDSHVHVIDAATMKRARTIALPNATTVVLSADGKLLAATTPPGRLHVFETVNGLERLQPLPGRVAAFTPNGARLARADTAESLRVTDVVSGESTFACTHLSADGVTGLSWSADGEALVSADAGPTGRVRVWRPNREKPVAEWVADGGVAVFANEQIVGLNGKRVAVWDAAGKPVRAFGANVSVLAVSGDGKVAATAGGEPRISIWDVATGKQRWTEPDDLGVIRDLAASRTGEVLVAAERGVAAWTPGDRPTVRVQTPPSSLAVLGGSCSASVADGKLAVREGAATRTFDLGSANPLAACLAAADEFVFVSFDDKTLKQLDAKTSRVVRSWQTPSTVPAMTATRDGQLLVGVGRDGFVRAWPLTGGPPLWSLRVARSLRPAVAVSSDSKLVAVTSVVRVDVFEAATGRRLFHGDRTWNDGPFQAVAFSPDGRLVAAGMQGSAGGVTVWETATGSFVARLEGGCGSVTKLLFLPDYRLVSASVDDNLLAWDLAPKRAAASKAELDAAWEKLADPAGEVGFANERLLAHGGENAVAVIAAGVRGIRETQKKMDALVKDLGHAEFGKRDAAYKALRDLGMIAVPTVAAAIDASGDPEVVQRAEKLMAEFAKKGWQLPRYGLYADRLRVHRAVWALERIGTPAAVRVLDEMAGLPGGEGATAAKGRLKK
jgi:WD40 repeat protein